MQSFSLIKRLSLARINKQNVSIDRGHRVRTLLVLILNATQTRKLCGNNNFCSCISVSVVKKKSLKCNFYEFCFSHQWVCSLLYIVKMLQKERKKTRCRFFVLFFFFILIFRVCALTFPIVWWLCFNFKYFFGPFISVKLKQFWHFFFLARMRFFSVRFSFVYLYSNYAVFCCTRLILGRYIYFVYDFRTFVLLFSWVSTVDAVAYIAVTVAVAVVVAATAAAAAVVAHCFVSKTIFGLFRWLRAVLSLKHCFTFLSLTLHCVLNLDICWTFNIRHGFFLSLVQI